MSDRTNNVDNEPVDFLALIDNMVRSYGGVLSIAEEISRLDFEWLHHTYKAYPAVAANLPGKMVAPVFLNDLHRTWRRFRIAANDPLVHIDCTIGDDDVIPYKATPWTR